MPKHPTRSVFWIFAALVLFAFGYVGYGLYRAARDDAARSQPVPALPSGSIP